MNRFLKKILFTVLFIAGIVFTIPVLAYSNPGTPTGFVNDYTNTLKTDQKNLLEVKLSDFEKSSANEIAVVIIKSLDGDTIENFASKLFEDWKIGKKDSDNGALILVAISDRKMRIEVGYGLEGDLTDAQSFWIVDDIMKPAFKDGRYYDGLNEATDKIIAILKGEINGSETATSTEANYADLGPGSDFYVEQPDNSDFAVGSVFTGLFMLIFALKYFLSKKNKFSLPGAIAWAGGLVMGLLTAGGIGDAFIFGGFFGLFSLFFEFIVRNAKGGGGSSSGGWHSSGGFSGGSSGSSGGGGFGGFGGGRSGGGGASGGW